jgi:hypothetical protein
MGQELSLDDYLVGGVTMFDAQTGLSPAGMWNDLCLLARVIIFLLTCLWCRGEGWAIGNGAV